MACYHPIPAWRTQAGIVFVDRGAGDRLDLPCGRCIGCRLERSRQWAARIMFEAQMHERNSFLTLTYSPENLPFPPSLEYKHFQDFMKRLRSSLDRKVRFYMCGEYGEQFARPHYHVALFGEDFSDDRVFWSKSGDFPLYRSPLLERLWSHGFCSIGDLTFESAAYVARYVMKKVTGDLAEEHYRFVDVNSGEVYQLTPEFCRMSLKPGIGGRWFDLYSSDVYSSHDYVVVNGRKCKPPRYFDRLLKRKAPDLYQDVKDAREWRGYQQRADNTDVRLAVKETVQRAALNTLKPRNGDF